MSTMIFCVSDALKEIISTYFCLTSKLSVGDTTEVTLSSGCEFGGGVGAQFHLACNPLASYRPPDLPPASVFSGKMGLPHEFVHPHPLIPTTDHGNVCEAEHMSVVIQWSWLLYRLHYHIKVSFDECVSRGF